MKFSLRLSGQAVSEGSGKKALSTFSTCGVEIEAFLQHASYYSSADLVPEVGVLVACSQLGYGLAKTPFSLKGTELAM